MTLGPFETEVGEPLPVIIWVRRDNPFDEDDDQGISFRWHKYQGPGEVMFEVVGSHRMAPDGRAVIESEMWLEAEDAWGTAATEVAFLEPGNYKLLLQAYNDSGGRTQPSDFEFFCCWTNVMVDVTVTP